VSESTTVRVQHYLERLIAGDDHARDELIECAYHRLLAIVAKALAGFPGVRRFERDSDVLRIRTKLQDQVPASPREFFALVSRWVRDEIIALLRHYHGPLGEGTNLQPCGIAGTFPDAASDNSADPSRLGRWTRFHECVDQLDCEERELFGLMWYHGLRLKDAAEVLQMPERTAKRRWREVRLKLREQLAGEMLE
jgi:DNA-directed RNA polymerase specialized sigma24 family protein